MSPSVARRGDIGPPERQAVTENDTNGITDVFVKSLATGVTTRASVSTTGGQATRWYSRYPSISSDGRYVSFEAKADGLVSSDQTCGSTSGTTTRRVRIGGSRCRRRSRTHQE